MNEIESIRRQQLDIPPMALAGYAKLIAQDAEAQRGRWPLELVQNAEDALHRGGRREGRAVFVEAGEDLLFANDGAPFTLEDVRGLSVPGLSGKHGGASEVCRACGHPLSATIGHKGIGFTATRELTSRVEVFSAGVAAIDFRFDPQAAWRAYRGRWGAVIDEHIRDRVGWWSLCMGDACPSWFPPLCPLSALPRSAVIDALLSEGFLTVFRFPGVTAAARPVLIQALEQDLPPALLFFQHLSRLELRLADGVHSLERRPDPGGASIPEVERVTLAHDLRESSWFVLRDEGRDVPGTILAEQSTPLHLTRFRCAVAAPERPSGDGSLCVHYPTSHPSGFRLHLHADLRTDPSRRTLRASLPFNRWGLPELARFFCGKAVPALTRLAEVRGDRDWLLQLLGCEQEGEPIASHLRSLCLAGEEEGEHAWSGLGALAVVPAGGGWSEPAKALALYGHPKVAEIVEDVFPLVTVPAVSLRHENVLRWLGVAGLRPKDIGALADALKNRIRDVEQAVAVLHALRDLAGRESVRDEGLRRSLRAVPCFPVADGEGGIQFIDALGFEPAPPPRLGAPPTLRELRPWLAADKLEAPPVGLQRRERLVIATFQYEDGEREREGIGWLNESRVLLRQRGRPLAAAMAEELVADWRTSDSDGGWADRLSSFFRWVLRIAEDRETGWSSEHIQALRTLPLPATVGDRPWSLVPAQQVIVARSPDLAALGILGPPLLERRELEVWLGDEDACARIVELLGLPDRVTLTSRNLRPLTRAAGAVTEHEVLAVEPATERGERLLAKCWREWQANPFGSWGQWTTEFWTDGPLWVLPGWVWDVLAAEQPALLPPLYRLLDAAWDPGWDTCTLRRGRKGQRQEFDSPALHALKTLAWVACTDGTVRRAEETVHLCDAGSDLDQGLLPVVHSVSYTALERALGVGWLGNWRSVARLAGDLVRSVPGGEGGARARSGWVRTLHGLYSRLSQCLEAELLTQPIATLRAELERRMPTILGADRIAVGPVPWACEQPPLVGVPSHLVPRIRELRSIFHFGAGRFQALQRVLGLPLLSEVMDSQLDPPWEALGSWDGPVDRIVSLLRATLEHEGAPPDTIVRATKVEVRAAERLSIEFLGDRAPVTSHGDLRTGRVAVLAGVGAEALAEGLDQAFPGFGVKDHLWISIQLLLEQREERAWVALSEQLEVDVVTLRGLATARIETNAQRPPGPEPTVDMGISTGAVQMKDEDDTDAEHVAVTEPTLCSEIDNLLDKLQDAPLLEAHPHPGARHHEATGRTGGDVHIGRPNQAQGRAAEIVCARHLARLQPQRAVHDVHRRPWFGCDFVLTSREAPEPPTGVGDTVLQAWIRDHAKLLVECKSSSEAEPRGVLFPDREVRRATWAASVGIPYEVWLWHMEELQGAWKPLKCLRVPAPVQGQVGQYRVQVTWGMMVGRR